MHQTVGGTTYFYNDQQQPTGGGGPGTGSGGPPVPYGQPPMQPAPYLYAPTHPQGGPPNASATASSPEQAGGYYQHPTQHQPQHPQHQPPTQHPQPENYTRYDQPPQQGTMARGGVSGPGSLYPRPTPYRSAAYYNMSENLRHNLVRKSQLQQPSIETNINQRSSLPTRVAQHYHTLSTLEPNKSKRSENTLKSRTAQSFAELQSQVYKCTNQARGSVCVLRRITSPTAAELNLDAAQQLVSHWQQFSHPYVVTLRNVFTSSDFTNASEVVFEYDYAPGALTLEQGFLSNAQAPAEDQLWHIAVGVMSALKTIHDMGTACRCITPGKIMLSPGNRVHISCIGLLDVVRPTQGTTLEELQNEDLIGLGETLLVLTCHNKQANFEMLRGTSYSNELKQFIHALIGNANLTVYEALSFLSEQTLVEVGTLQGYNDIIEEELQKEIHNGRLFRLICKLGFINERPDFDYDAQWSETGDRYILKLFRDHLFHQSTDKGSPKIDWGHVLSTLNKLDVGSEEKVALESRDHQNLLIVSFRDIKRLVDECFNELMYKQTNPGLGMGDAMGNSMGQH